MDRVDPPPAGFPPEIVTPRLVLRPVRRDDAPDIFAYASSPAVARWVAWEAHRDLGDTLGFIEQYALPSYARGVPDPLAITLAGSPRVVGTVGCHWVAEAHRAMELGYVLGEPWWGRGIASEAAAAVMDYVFEHFPVERIQARCATEHAASRRVMEKLGLCFEGVERSAMLHAGRFWDLACLSILRGEWRQRKNPTPHF